VFGRQEVNLAVEEDLFVLVLFLRNEAGLADCVLVGLGTEARQSALVSRTLHLAVRLTIKDVLRPCVIFLEAGDDVTVHEVLHAGRIHELPKLHAIVLEAARLLFTEVECFQHFVVLELETSLHCAVLHEAEDLKIELRVLDEAAIPADLLARDVSFALVAPVLNLDKVDVDNKAANLDHVPDNRGRWNLLKQHDAVVCLKVVHFLDDAAEYLHVLLRELQLCVHVKVITDLALSAMNQQDHALVNEVLQVDLTVVPDEERELGLVVDRLHINL
jgi:hypothetical protein